MGAPKISNTTCLGPVMCPHLGCKGIELINLSTIQGSAGSSGATGHQDPPSGSGHTQQRLPPLVKYTMFGSRHGSAPRVQQYRANPLVDNSGPRRLLGSNRPPRPTQQVSPIKGKRNTGSFLLVLELSSKQHAVLPARINTRTWLSLITPLAHWPLSPGAWARIGRALS